MRPLYKIYGSCALLICCCATLMAQDVAMDERNIDKTYFAGKGMYVELSNKYGDIEIVPWEKDSVRVQVSIRSYSDKYDQRKSMMESIDVEFTKSSGFLVVETDWNEEAGIWRKSTYNMQKNLLNDYRVEVSYIVSLPKRVPLEIDNRFGNVFIGDHDAELNVKVHHGDFRARRLKDLRKLDIRYGKAKIKEVEKGQLDMGSGSELDLDTGGDIMITSSSSEIEIEEVASLNINSKHDDITIQEPEVIIGSFSLSDLKVNSLGEKLKAECRFGSVRIQEIGHEASSVEITGNKTDIIVGLSVGFAGRFDIDVDGEENLIYPEDMYVVSSGLDENKRLQLNGAMGTRAGTAISISSSNGDVKIGR